MRFQLAVRILGGSLALAALQGCGSGGNDSAPIQATPEPPVAAIGYVSNTGAINEPLELEVALPDDLGDEQFSFEWRIIKAPHGANAQLASVEAESTSLTGSMPGCYRVGLMSRSGDVESDELTVDLTLGTPIPEELNEDVVLLAADSPFYLESTHSISSDASLVIEPGVTVMGPLLHPSVQTSEALARIRVAGALTAHGTVSAPVVFRGIAMWGGDAAGQNQGGSVELESVIMDATSELFPIIGGATASASIKNSLFEMETPRCCGDIGDVNLLDVGSYDVVGNIFTGPIHFLLISSRQGSHINFSRNWFTEVGVTFSETRQTSDGTSVLMLQGNNIESGQIRLVPGAQNASIVATGNWWGTTDETDVSDRIFDRNDDVEIGRYVEYSPILAERNPEAPDEDVLNRFRQHLAKSMCSD